MQTKIDKILQKLSEVQREVVDLYLKPGIDTRDVKIAEDDLANTIRDVEMISIKLK